MIVFVCPYIKGFLWVCELQPQGNIKLLPCSVVSHRAITCYCPALGLLQSIMAYIAQSVPLIVWLQGLQILLWPIFRNYAQFLNGPIMPLIFPA